MRLIQKAKTYGWLAGALLPLAFAPFDIWPLAILLPIALMWCWDSATPHRAARDGFLFGLGAYGFGIYWIYISLHDYGHAPAAFSVLATFGVVFLMALYWAILGGLVAKCVPTVSPARDVFIIPALWTMIDLIRSELFTGFPWLAIGYSQIDAPLSGLAPILGVFGVGWAVIVNAGLIKTVIQSPSHAARMGWGSGLLALWVGAWGVGHITWVEPIGAPLRVSLVQGNIAQDQKWQGAPLAAVAEYVQLSLPEHGHTDVIIWPETAIPAFFDEMQPFITALEQKARADHVDYLTGIVTGSWEKKNFHNSIVRVGDEVQFYHKRRLLVFGEYLPLRTVFAFFRHFVDIPMADFTAGEVDQPLMRAGGQPVGASICFEAVFGAEMRRALPEATWLVNVSNDAWFKDSTAPHQHLQITRMRALEMGRYLARATNTGVSAIVDERGQIRTRGTQFTAEVIRGAVQPLGGLTPYARFGDWPVILLMMVLLGMGGWCSHRQRRIPRQ